MVQVKEELRIINQITFIVFIIPGADLNHYLFRSAIYFNMNIFLIITKTNYPLLRFINHSSPSA